MHVLLVMLMGVMAARQSPPGQGFEHLAWSDFLGYWRIDPTVTEPGPNSAFRLRIQIEGEELTIERHGFSMTEISRYRLDGTTTRTVLEGRSVDASVAIEYGGLVFRTRITLPDGRVSNVKELCTLQRRFTMLMTVERTTTIGNRTIASTDLLRRLPPPRPLHPDNQP